jgi:hypothetical protein
MPSRVHRNRMAAAVVAAFVLPIFASVAGAAPQETPATAVTPVPGLLGTWRPARDTGGISQIIVKHARGMTTVHVPVGLRDRTRACGGGGARFE